MDDSRGIQEFVLPVMTVSGVNVRGEVLGSFRARPVCSWRSVGLVSCTARVFVAKCWARFVHGPCVPAATLSRCGSRYRGSMRNAMICVYFSYPKLNSSLRERGDDNTVIFDVE